MYKYLNTKSYFTDFTNEVNSNEDVKCIKLYQDSLSSIEGKLSSYKDFINTHCKNDYNSVLLLTTIREINNLKFFLNNQEEEDKSNYVKSYLRSRLLFSKKIKEKRKKINVNLLDISYTEYAFIIREFNKLIFEEILKGYIFNIGWGLGAVYVIKHNKVKKKDGKIIPRPDWGASNKQKQYLIDKGILPYEAIKDKEGNIIGDNGGTKWIIYADPTNCWFKWNKGLANMANTEYYSCNFTDQNKKALAKFTKENIAFHDKYLSNASLTTN